jgi:predicted ABC-class ATPase
MGGSGDYFEVADTVIAMDNFQAHNVTEKAKEIAQNYTSDRLSEGGGLFGVITTRIPLPESIDPSRGPQDVKLKVRKVDEVVFGTEDIDLKAVEQLVDSCQLRAIAAAIVYAKKKNLINGDRALPEILNIIMADIAARGLDILSEFPQGDFACFRRFEVAAALNRLRSLSCL